MFQLLRAKSFVCFMALWLCLNCRADAPEFRAFWVDAYHNGFKDKQQVSRLVADVRAANCNVIVMEVRRRGDAYYNSNIDPKAEEIAPGFDPLAEVIAQAHDTNAGPRLEVHAWIVAFPVWDSDTNWPSPHHAFSQHQDWLTKDMDGKAWNYKDYTFDPGHPGVQKYLYDISMEIISRYDVDGFQLDYIRYCNNNFGYNAKSLARFNALSGRRGRPLKSDPAWMQFRRDQVTGLVRKIYLNALALKPKIVISVAGNSYAPGVATLAQWPGGSAFGLTLQDWRGWLEEGMVDLVMPMDYFRAEKFARAWAGWTMFDKDHAYQRGVVIGPGIFLNTVSNTLAQLHSARVPTPSGNRALGLVLYSYSEISTENISHEEFFKALTQPTVYDYHPVFAQPVSVPPLPWKSHPTKGHLMGFVYGASGEILDGAKVTLHGVVDRIVKTDATGFYGAVDLPPGKYEASAAFGGDEIKISTPVEIKMGVVASQKLIMGKVSGH